MKTGELRDMTQEELAARAKQLREELFNLKFQHAIGQLENNSRLNATKKDIARVLTVMRELGSNG